MPREAVLFRYIWASPNTAIGLVLALAVLAARGRGRFVRGVFEAHGPLARVALRRCVPVPGGASAITFGHIVIGRDAACLEMSRAHERVHVRQCEVWGPAFIPAYLLASLWGWLAGTGGYGGNYFERDAVRRAGVRHGKDKQPKRSVPPRGERSVATAPWRTLRCGRAARPSDPDEG